MQVIKIATAGSVDDGKSTLIGRLLYDTQSLTDDKLAAIEKSSAQKGYDYLDFSLATDGLVAERAQGITIDVAHIYFSTQKRSYIIADTPGHIEYTRNMVTGASTAQVAIVLIDARKGVVEQTYRHFFISNLLRVKEVIVAVNKMDLVDYSETVFDEIVADFKKLNAKSSFQEQKITFVPVSALKGENVVAPSNEMSWYKGASILSYLESLSPKEVTTSAQVRFPVQSVIRPKTEAYHDFRGYAGKVYGGALQVGESVTVLPSNTQSTIKEIHFFDHTYEQANAGDAVTITLNDDVNITRGDILVKSNEIPKVAKSITAKVCWMDQKPLQIGGKYVVQHHTNKVLAKIKEVGSVIATDFSDVEKNTTSGQLQLNEIGEVSLQLSKPLYFDTYEENKENGAFIVVDTQTNTTAGVGFITA